MDKAHPLSTLVILRTFDLNKDHEDNEKLFGLEVSYINTSGH